jgi:hypothetical protein
MTAPGSRHKPQRQGRIRQRHLNTKIGGDAGTRPRDQRSTGASGGAALLIRFDRKTQAFLACVLLFLFLATLFKVHGSSVAMWNRLLPERPPDSGVLWGTPRRIRIDEWAFDTTAIINQARLRPAYPVVNTTMGLAPVPLITGLPVRHWSALVRPATWGYFVVDLERAFAFSWNLQTCTLLIGMFLLLMLLTGNQFDVSLLGTAWVFFSGFTQWWYSVGLPGLIGEAALLIVAVHYLTLSSSRRAMVGWAVLFIACSITFALKLYPPWQVPLVYLAIAVTIGSLRPHLWTGAWKNDLTFRAVCTTVTLIILAALLALYYHDAKPAIDRMRGTVYPGARLVTGGDISLAQAFGGFYGFFMSEQHVPPDWVNVCEASNYVLFFPIPMAAALWRAGRRLPVGALEWALIVYIVVELTWIIVGFPAALASASGFALSQANRSQLGVGVASILLCSVFLARSRNDLPAGFLRRALLAGSLCALLVAYGLYFNRVTEGFVTSGQLLTVSLIATAAAYMLLSRAKKAFAALIIVPLVASYGLVNPVAVGLGPVLDTDVFRQVSRIVDRDPDAGWIVYGGGLAPELLRTTGARVLLGGTKWVPPLDELKVLDPQASAVSVYNRFAHVALTPVEGDTINFKLGGPDNYAIEIDPKSDRWRQLGIRYVVLPARSTDREFIAKTTLVQNLNDVGLWIYRFRS